MLGKNVYVDVPKDYTGDLVTPENFLKVLNGKDMNGIGSGKTLKSGPNDHVFVYFADHGAPGFLAFPGGKKLYAKDLIPTLEKMSKDKMFDQMVMYVEACESGSMFNKLLKDDLRIYVTTAANPFESSYACNYDRKYNTYLNDCYSITFMQDTEESPLKESLQEQFEHVKKALSSKSHVCQYGDLSIAKQSVKNYMGIIVKDRNVTSSTSVPNIAKSFDAFEEDTSVSSRDVQEMYLIKQLESASAETKKEWQAKLDEYRLSQARGDIIFGAFSSSFNLHLVRDARDAVTDSDDDRCHADKLDIDCMKDSVIAYEEECGLFDEYSIRYASYLRDACDAKIGVDIVKQQFNKICSVVKKL